MAIFSGVVADVDAATEMSVRAIGLDLNSWIARAQRGYSFNSTGNQETIRKCRTCDTAKPARSDRGRSFFAGAKKFHSWRGMWGLWRSRFAGRSYIAVIELVRHRRIKHAARRRPGSCNVIERLFS